MTRTTVKLINGLHITAADKRNIVDCIAYLVDQLDKSGQYDLLQWCKRSGSSKSYQITKEAERGVYSVAIKSNESTDYGAPTVRTSVVRVEVSGIAHLPSLSEFMDQIEARAEAGRNPTLPVELTEAGEQTVIPGCERNAAPGARQLDLFG